MYQWGSQGYIYICGPYEEMVKILQQLQEDKAYVLVVAPQRQTEPC